MYPGFGRRGLPAHSLALVTGIELVGGVRSGTVYNEGRHRNLLEHTANQFGFYKYPALPGFPTNKA
jgi:hypothetical protein